MVCQDSVCHVYTVCILSTNLPCVRPGPSALCRERTQWVWRTLLSCLLIEGHTQMVRYVALLGSMAWMTQVQGWPCSPCSGPVEAGNVMEAAHFSGWEKDTSLSPAPSGIEAEWLWKEPRSALPDQKGASKVKLLGSDRAQVSKGSD